MAQFDVHVNPSESAAHGIPFVFEVQSDLLDALATRMSIPLAAIDFSEKSPNKLCPVVMVKGQQLRALALCAAPLPARSLREKLGNLAAQASVLIAAMDEVVSGV